MLDALVRGVMIVAQTSANAFEFVGRHRDAHAAAANQKTALGLSRTNIFGHEHSVIRVVVRLIGLKRTDIMDRMTELLHKLDQHAFHFKTGVIRTNGNSHGYLQKQRSPGEEWSFITVVRCKNSKIETPSEII
jgi:hypothetical protein